MATLVAMATVHEKFQMTFPIKVLRQFLWNFIFSIYMLVVQNLAKKNYLLKFKMAAMPIYFKNRSNDFFSKTTVPIRLIFCMKHMGHLTILNAKIIPVGS